MKMSDTMANGYGATRRQMGHDATPKPPHEVKCTQCPDNANQYRGAGVRCDACLDAQIRDERKTP